jgi:dTDP-4-dehydrorhamnose 3,5-epimerase
MELVPTHIEGCFIVQGEAFADERGTFAKPFTREMFSAVGLTFDFGEMYWSRSKCGTIRGMHFQVPPADVTKLVWCTAGAVMDVVVDLRKRSATHSIVVTTELGEGGNAGIVVPSGCAHGFAVSAGEATVCYITSGPYSPECDAGVRFDSVGVDWGIEDPILSTRDQGFPSFLDFASPY